MKTITIDAPILGLSEVKGRILMDHLNIKVRTEKLESRGIERNIFLYDETKYKVTKEETYTGEVRSYYFDNINGGQLFSLMYCIKGNYYELNLNMDLEMKYWKFD